MQLGQMRLVCSTSLCRNVDMERIVSNHPVMVAGDKEFDTELML